MFDQVFERIVHGARFGMARIEKHQYQVREIDNVVRDLQRRRALRVGIKTWGIDNDFAAYLIARARFQLQLTNISGDNLSDVFLQVNTLTGGNVVILQTDEFPIGCTTELFCQADGTETLAPGESFSAAFEIGLQDLRPFRFFVDVFDRDGRNRVICPCKGNNFESVVWDETFMPTSCTELRQAPSDTLGLLLLNDDGEELSADTLNGNECFIRGSEGAGIRISHFSSVRLSACVTSLRQIAAAAGVDCPE